MKQHGINIMQLNHKPSTMKDIKYIEIQYLSKTKKPKTKITLTECIMRQDAIKIADLIRQNESVFLVTCHTTNNSFI